MCDYWLNSMVIFESAQSEKLLFCTLVSATGCDCTWDHFLQKLLALTVYTGMRHTQVPSARHAMTKVTVFLPFEIFETGLESPCCS